MRNLAVLGASTLALALLMPSPSHADEIATPPQNLHVVKLDDLPRVITLGWDAPATPGGATYGVDLEASTDNGATWTSVQDLTEMKEPGSDAYDVGILNGGDSNATCKSYIYPLSGKTYQFKIATITEANGTSVFSDPIAVTLAKGKPSRPSYSACTAGLRFFSKTNKVPFTVSWEKPIDNGGYPILGYKVRYATCSWSAKTETGKITSKWTTLPPLKASQLSLKMAQLTKGKCWNVTAAAFNAKGTGDWQGSGFHVIDKNGNDVIIKQG